MLPPTRWPRTQVVPKPSSEIAKNTGASPDPESMPPGKRATTEASAPENWVTVCVEASQRWSSTPSGTSSRIGAGNAGSAVVVGAGLVVGTACVGGTVGATVAGGAVGAAAGGDGVVGKQAESTNTAPTVAPTDIVVRRITRSSRQSFRSRLIRRHDRVPEGDKAKRTTELSRCSHSWVLAPVTTRFVALRRLNSHDPFHFGRRELFCEVGMDDRAVAR